jgi:hypothetical protein
LVDRWTKLTLSSSCTRNVWCQCCGSTLHRHWGTPQEELKSCTSQVVNNEHFFLIIPQVRTSKNQRQYCANSTNTNMPNRSHLICLVIFELQRDLQLLQVL